jgi:hypothetical protein
MSCLALTEPRPAVRSALAVGGDAECRTGRLAKGNVGRSSSQNRWPFQLAEPTSAEMAYDPSIGYVRPKMRERVRRSAGDRGRGRNISSGNWRSRLMACSSNLVI